MADALGQQLASHVLRERAEGMLPRLELGAQTGARGDHDRVLGTARQQGIDLGGVAGVVEDHQQA